MIKVKSTKTKPVPSYIEITSAKKSNIRCSGFCPRCNEQHSLPAEPARQSCLELMTRLEYRQRIDLDSTPDRAEPCFSTKYLFGPARGKMFGILIADTPDNKRVELRAFSGQYNGVWQVAGWVEPVFDLTTFHKIHDHRERKIKTAGKQIDALEKGAQQQKLIAKRKKMSQQLMRDIHDMYRIKNFQGESAGLQQLFQQISLTGRGIPTGTGDCCAPKLLQHAVQHNLTPLSLAEFYWGRTNASATRRHGCFYPSCEAKCSLLVGFMLCGLGD